MLGIMFGLMVMLIGGLSWVYVLVMVLVSVCLVFSEFYFEYFNWHVYMFDIGADVFGVGFVLLSVWVITLMMMAGCARGGVGLLVIYLIMVVILAMVFMSLDFMLFYLLFEAVLVPTVILVLGWGYQPERLGAGLYLLFYTVFCSLPLLILVILIKGEEGVMGLLVVDLWFYGWKGGGAGLLGFFGLIAFLVSVPLFGLHLWLPKAHVEAPVSGSMILAGVLLKLGGYGMMRFSMYGWAVLSGLSGLFISLSLVGGVYLSLVCLRQVDLKSLIAYSSVVHMGLVVGGIMSGFSVGWVGGFIMMLGHGLCSSGLFYFAGVNYERLSSRSVLMNKGLMLIFPSSVLFWFLFVSSNMAAPPSLNLMGEIMLLGALLGLSFWFGVVLLFSSFLSGVYCLYLYSWVQHGRTSLILRGGEGLLVIEGLVSLLHWGPLNCLFLSGDLFCM